MCGNPLLQDKEKFPDSSFTASASSDGHSASHGRISSGSSWCDPVSNDKHYLQVDLGRLYVIYNFVTFGDSTSSKWVTMYDVNYSVDLRKWRSILNHKVINISYHISCGGQQRYNYIIEIFFSIFRYQETRRLSIKQLYNI